MTNSHNSLQKLHVGNSNVYLYAETSLSIKHFEFSVFVRIGLLGGVLL